MSITTKNIHDKAIELGYTACGIVKACDMRGYEDMINKRVETFPETQQYYSNFAGYANPEDNRPWVKSIIVCAGRYGKYKIPEELQGRIGKYYLTDYRVREESKEYKASVMFDEYLTENGVQIKKNSWSGGITAGKYAAVKSGIGIIRKNSLLYTEHGSWIWLETWLVDQEMEYINDNKNLSPCPDDCTKCIDSCGTGALAAPYQVHPFSCTSSLTWGGLPNTLPPKELRIKMRKWMYGCDDCQDCCPMNKDKWTVEEDFPGLDDLRKYLTLEQLCTLDDETLKSKLSPIFFYVGHEKIWKWKVHALRAMAYEYEPKYLPYIKQVLNSENQLVREMAKWVIEKLK